MKIFCIGRNYRDHAKELNNPVPKQPMVFIKPRTALLENGKPFYYPDFSSDVHFELELVIRMSGPCRAIPPEFASKILQRGRTGY